MQWATVFALLLLTGITSSSSDGSQSASLLSTTDPPTADLEDRPTVDDTPPPPIDDAPDDVHVVGSTAHRNTADEDCDETSISKRHDTGDSDAVDEGTGDGALQTAPNLTAPMNSVDAEDSSSLAGEVSSITSSERTMESEAASPSSPFDDSYRYEDEDPVDARDDGRSSNGHPQPKADASLGRQEDRQSLPLGAGTTSTTNSTALKGLSSSVLKTKLDQAKLSLNVTTTTRDSAEKEWKMKVQEAVGPNREYEEKKKEWEKLVKIADEKSKAESEFETADDLLTTLTAKYNTAKADFEEKNDEVDAVIAQQDEIPKWPAQMQDATTKYNDKSGTKDPLAREKKEREEKVTETAGKLKARTKIEQETIRSYNNSKCDDPAQSSTVLCTGLRNDKDELIREVAQLHKDYDTALNEQNTTLAKIATLEKELNELSVKIGKLTIDMSTKTVQKSAEEIIRLRGELAPIQKHFDEVKKQKGAADADLAVKKLAKEAAEQSDGGHSAQAARQAAINAKALMGVAKKAKLKADGQVKESKTKLENAETDVKNAQSQVQSLKNLLEEAKNNEEAALKGSIVVPIVGGIVGFLAVVAVVAVAVFIVIRKHKKKKGIAKDKKDGGTSKGKQETTTRIETTPRIETKLWDHRVPIITEQPGLLPPKTTESQKADTAIGSNLLMPIKYMKNELTPLELPGKYDPKDHEARTVVPAGFFEVHTSGCCVKGKKKTKIDDGIHLLEDDPGNCCPPILCWDPKGMKAAICYRQHDEPGEHSETEKGGYLSNSRMESWKEFVKANVPEDVIKKKGIDGIMTVITEKNSKGSKEKKTKKKKSSNERKSRSERSSREHGRSRSERSSRERGRSVRV